jgi:hypothetical protein
VRSENICRRGSVANKSNSSQFSAQLNTLSVKIDKTVPHYVCCSKKDSLRQRESSSILPVASVAETIVLGEFLKQR